MKKLFALALSLLMLVCAQEPSVADAVGGFIGRYVSLYVTATEPVDLHQPRADLKKRCTEEKSECLLILIEKDGRRLATMDLDANWTEYASREEIADVLAITFPPVAPVSK